MELQFSDVIITLLKHEIYEKPVIFRCGDREKQKIYNGKIV